MSDWKSLPQLSEDYKMSCDLINCRLTLLRQQLKQTENPDEIFVLKNRIKQLTPILRDMRHLLEITAKYYEPSYYRDPDLSMNGCGVFMLRRCEYDMLIYQEREDYGIVTPVLREKISQSRANARHRKAKKIGLHTYGELKYRNLKK